MRWRRDADHEGTDAEVGVGGHRGPSRLNKGIKSKQRGGQRRAYDKGEGSKMRVSEGKN